MENNTDNFIDDQHAVIDYLDNGLWGLCITSRETARAGSVDEIIDTDEDLNNLIIRSVRTWGVDPTELWVSECARELVHYNLSGCVEVED
jgi:hypothetical protein